MTKRKLSPVEVTMKAAHEAHPDVWERVEAIARIINPHVFSDMWVDENGNEPMKTRREYLQSVAIDKAHEILMYLGVNKEDEWYDILMALRKKAA